MRITRKQKLIMRTIIAETKVSDDGEVFYPDISIIRESLPYEVTKQALVFSLRYLIQKGLLEKKNRELRGSKSKTPYAPTVLALSSYF